MIAGKCSQKTGAMNARPSAAATLLPLLAGVPGRVLADEPRQLLRGLAASPAAGGQPADGPARHVVDEPLRQVHPREDVGGHVLVQVGGHVAPAEHRIELDGIQVDDLDAVPGLAQPRRELVQDRVRERRGVRMGVHRQNPHPASSSRWPARRCPALAGG